MSCDDIELIPLTEDMLKANGFEFNGIFYSIFNSKYKCYYYVRYADNNTDGIIDWYYNYWVFDDNFIIDNTHELQHALRMCGLRELADNFKIE